MVNKNYLEEAVSLAFEAFGSWSGGEVTGPISVVVGGVGKEVVGFGRKANLSVTGGFLDCFGVARRRGVEDVNGLGVVGLVEDFEAFHQLVQVFEVAERVLEIKVVAHGDQDVVGQVVFGLVLDETCKTSYLENNVK